MVYLNDFSQIKKVEEKYVRKENGRKTIEIMKNFVLIVHKVEKKSSK